MLIGSDSIGDLIMPLALPLRTYSRVMNSSRFIYAVRKSTDELKREFPSIDFVMPPRRQQMDCFHRVMFYEFEEYPQIIGDGTSPDAVQIPFELVRSESWMKRIGGKQFKSQQEVIGRVGMFLQIPTLGAHEGR